MDAERPTSVMGRNALETAPGSVLQWVHAAHGDEKLWQ